MLISYIKLFVGKKIAIIKVRNKGNAHSLEYYQHIRHLSPMSDSSSFPIIFHMKDLLTLYNLLHRICFFLIFWKLYTPMTTIRFLKEPETILNEMLMIKSEETK